MNITSLTQSIWAPAPKVSATRPRLMTAEENIEAARQPTQDVVKLTYINEMPHYSLLAYAPQIPKFDSKVSISLPKVEQPEFRTPSTTAIMMNKAQGILSYRAHMSS